MTKQRRYRRKCIAEGRCPHCGEPCAPYLECETRRLKKAIYRSMSRLVATGAVARINAGREVQWVASNKNAPDPVTRKVRPQGDRRTLPRFADVPFEPDELILHLAHRIALGKPDRTVSEAEISAAFAKERLRWSRRKA